MTISHAKRVRNSTENALKNGPGLGGKVPADLMIRAAQAWLDQESSTGSKVSALAVARAINLTVAPEWLESDRFIRILEVERFKRRVLQLKALPELTQLIQTVIDLGLIEAQKRLVLSPGEIPNSTLFGDILFKLPKMVQDFTAGDRPVKAGDIMLTVVKEINLIGDPRTRELVRKQLMGNLDDIAKAVGSADPEVVDAEGHVVLLGDPVPVDGAIRVDHDGHQIPSPIDDNSDDSALWSDPALD